MIQYEVQLNQGNEALQTGKTITANEVLLTCDDNTQTAGDNGGDNQGGDDNGSGIE